MCGVLMFLMKSTELHWSTEDESGLSKAIRQVKDPLSTPCSSSRRDTAWAEERAAAPPRANCGGNARVWGQERQKLQVSSVAEILPCDIFRSVWCNNVDWGCPRFCMTLNFLKTLILWICFSPLSALLLLSILYPSVHQQAAPHVSSDFQLKGSC